MVQGPMELNAGAIEIAANIEWGRSMEPDAAKSQTDDGELADQSESEDPNKIIVLTCQGPLRISTVDKGKAGISGNRFEFNAYGEPVEIWNNDQLTARAGRIQYNHPEQTTKLLPAEGQQVWLSLGLRQNATARQGVNFDQRSGLATLLGPGKIEYVSAEAEIPTVIDYEDEVLVKFSKTENQKGNLPGASAGHLEWIEFTGMLRSKSPDSQLEANKTRLIFYPRSKTADNEDQPFLIQSIEVPGGMRAEGSDSLFRCEYLKTQFALNDAGVPELESMIATGGVKMEDPNWAIAVSESLQIDFEPLDALAVNNQPEVQPNGQQKKVSALGLGSLLGKVNTSRVVATGPGGGVKLIDKKWNFLVQATADRIEGNPRADGTIGKGNILKDGIWHVTGSPAEVELPQQGLLKGDNIHIDLASGNCQIPGKGSMKALTDSDLSGNKLDQPIPIEIAWGKQADYSMDSNEVVFHDVTATFRSKTEDSQVVSILTCPKMTVTLSKTTKATETIDNLSQLTAYGPEVKLVSEQFDPTGNQLQVRMELLSPQLRFDNINQRLTAGGEGMIEVTDYRPKPEESEVEKDKAISSVLSDSLRQSGPSYTLVHFIEQMQYDITDGNLLFEKDVILDRLPLKESIDMEQLTDGSVEGWMRLACDQLEVRPQLSAGENGKSTNITPEAGSTGGFAVDYLRAEGNVVFEMTRQNQERVFFSSPLLVYDKLSGTITVSGSESMPVRFNQMQLLWLRYHLDTGNFESRPIGQGVVNN